MQPHLPDLNSLHPDIDPDLELDLDADARAVVLRDLGNIATATHSMHQSISKWSKNVPPTVSFASAVLRSIEYGLRDLSKALGVPTQTQAEVDARYASLRAANMRIHEMEAEMAARSTHGVAFGIKALEERFSRWWRHKGFGHVSEMHFHSYGMRAKLSAHLFGMLSMIDSDSPVSDRETYKQWLDGLRARGFVLAQEREGQDRDTFLVDCDASRQALERIVADSLPSCEILEIVSHSNKGHMSLRDIDVLVRNLDEIAELPGVLPC